MECGFGAVDGGILGQAGNLRMVSSLGAECVGKSGFGGGVVRENAENLHIFAIFPNFLVDTCGIRWFNWANRRK